MTMTTNTQSNGRRGSTADNSGSAGKSSVRTPKGIAEVAAGTVGGGRRKSSSALNLNFLAVGKEKIVPISEGRNAEAGKEEEGAVKRAMTPYERSLLKRGNVTSGA